MRRNKVCCSTMTWTYVIGELHELLEELLHLNWCGIKSEFMDIFSCSQIALWDSVSINGWVLETKNIKNWEYRYKWFERFLVLRGIEFKKEYMKNGSNHMRWHKVLSVWKEGTEDMINMAN